MCTTANKLHLEGFAENKVGAKTPAGSISKWGDVLQANIYKKNIYTATKRETGFARRARPQRPWRKLLSDSGTGLDTLGAGTERRPLVRKHGTASLK